MGAFIPSYGSYVAPAYGYSEATGWPTIKQGALDQESGGAVSALVKLLRSASYTGKDDKVLNTLKPDGTIKFGAKIDSEVRKFQRAKKLGDDGIVGPGTWRALGGKSATPAGGGGGGAVASAAPPAAEAPPEAPASSGGITSSPYFLPSVIVGSTAIVGAVVYFTFFYNSSKS